VPWYNDPSILHGICIILALLILICIAAFCLLFTHYTDVIHENLNYVDTQAHLDFQLSVLQEENKRLKIQMDDSCYRVKSYF
jgi:hypothetical protein